MLGMSPPSNNLSVTEPLMNELLEILIIPQLVEAAGFFHRVFEIRIGFNGFLQKEDGLFPLPFNHVYISQII